MLSIQKAGVEDLPLIRQLALEIWPKAYNGIISEEQISYMLDLIYSLDALTDQVMVQQHNFIILLDETQPIGFASYGKKSAAETEIYRLNKIYLFQGQQGKGSGRFLLNTVIDEAKSAGARQLQLNVNKQNPAIGFYRRNGFEIIKDEIIDINNGFVMDDYIMALNLEVPN